MVSPFQPDIQHDSHQLGFCAKQARSCIEYTAALEIFSVLSLDIRYFKPCFAISLVRGKTISEVLS